MSETKLFVQRKGFLNWQAEIRTPTGRYVCWGSGFSRSGAIRNARKRLRERNQPWMEVRDV